MQTALEIIIDYSASMGISKQYLLPDGNTRMSIAKKALVENIIPTLDYAEFVSIRHFYSDKAKKLVLTHIFEGKFEMETIVDKIKTLPDPNQSGGTPISAALEQVFNFLEKRPFIDKKIILVTDGEESDGGNYIALAESKSKQTAIPCNIFIIGIAQTTQMQERCRKLCESRNGGYINKSSQL